MKPVSRRDMLKAGLLVPAAAAAHGLGPIGAAAIQAAQEDPASLPIGEAPESAKPGTGRERLLLDFGWRFHFGNANDPPKTLDWERKLGIFRRQEISLVPAVAFDDSDWRGVDLPHDWAVELPFQNDPALSSKGFYPLGRNYPATSVGWYRRVFELPAADAGKRITIEFDGSYRETMVVFNGFYIGRHSGGYDPFSFDVTDFVISGRKKCPAGSRGCDVERWMVLRRSGNLQARLAGEDASGAREAVGHLRAAKVATGQSDAFDPH